MKKLCLHVQSDVITIHSSDNEELLTGSILLLVVPSWKVRGLLQTAKAKARKWRERKQKATRSTEKMYQKRGLEPESVQLLRYLHSSGE